MKTKCKIAGDVCPLGLNICCGTCGFRNNCVNCCEDESMKDPQNCPEAEPIGDELVQFQSAVPAVLQMITDVIRQKKELDDREKHLKAQLVAAMEAYGVKAFENDHIKMVYVAPTTRTTVDTAKLKQFYPEEYELCSKTSNVAASVRVTLKGGAK